MECFAHNNLGAGRHYVMRCEAVGIEYMPTVTGEIMPTKRRSPAKHTLKRSRLVAAFRQEAPTQVKKVPNPGRPDAVRKKRMVRETEDGKSLFKDDAQLSIDEVRKGLPISALDELARELNVERMTLAQILGTSVRTLQRKEGGSERLGPAASDRIARITRILSLAIHVFGESGKAAGWLTSKSRALAGEIPLYMLDTDIGTQHVQQELRQIEFGMPF